MAGRDDDNDPVMDMNTTPLIDVMLVLLVMFIITIPIQSHAVKIDLPINDPHRVQPPTDPHLNRLSVDPAGTILWNSSPVDLITLRSYLERTRLMTVEPELHFQPAAQARYDVVDQVLAAVKGSAVTKMGFVGNEQYARFGK